MNQSDIAIATAGISAPIWVSAVNEWIGLVLGLMSIVYVGWKLWNLYKGKGNG